MALVMVTGCSTLDAETPRDAAVWISPNGSEWTRIGDPELAGPGEQQMTAVACDESMILAGGTEIVDGEREAAVWISEDGLEWQRSHDPDLGGVGDQWIWDVAISESGLIAVGSSGPNTDQDTAMWVSRNGSEWTRVDDGSSFGGRGAQVATAVAPFQNGMVAVGQDDGDAAVWMSEDGGTWVRMDDPILKTGGHQTMTVVTADEWGLIAAGESDNDAAVWRFDGTSWSRGEKGSSLGGYGRQAIEDLIVGDDGMVAVGNEYVYDEIYLRGGSRGTFDGVVWTSADGRGWTRVEEADAFEGVGEQTVSSLIEWNGGLLAVGYDLAGRGSVQEGGLPFGSGEDVDASVWLSADGWSWAKVQSPEFGGEDWQDMYDVADCPGVGLVAVGGDDLGTPPG